MFYETISNEYIVTQNGTSDGTQIKYFKDGYWYKEDNSSTTNCVTTQRQNGGLYEQNVVFDRWKYR